MCMNAIRTVPVVPSDCKPGEDDCHYNLTSIYTNLFTSYHENHTDLICTKQICVTAKRIKLARFRVNWRKIHLQMHHSTYISFGLTKLN